MSSQSDLGRIDDVERTSRPMTVTRWLLLIGWALAALGFLGPWVEHHTAALSLSGADMGEFVKFLPGAFDDSLWLVRQLFYLPPFAVATSLALLIHSPRLGYGQPMRVVGWLLAVPVSLQLLPPAWSPSSLVASEFRTQTICLIVCWLLLAGSWLFGRLPALLPGLSSAALCSVALLLTTWQFLVVMPEIGEIYSTIPAIGWGFFLCIAGLGIGAIVSAQLALTAGSQLKNRGTGG